MASVTEVKNNLSRFLELVRNGESVLITDRGVPVARIESVRAERSESAERARLGRLERAGLVRKGEGIPRRLLARKVAGLKRGASAVDALLDERHEGR
ncbi:MAG: type II toxin-antitoxin system Phd/YefM family antitoxin [Thermoanaerobaculia bacterium]